MRITRRWIAAMAASILVSSVPVSSYGAVYTYTTKATQTTTGKAESVSKDNTYSKENYGPGYLFQAEDETAVEFTGPSVKKVTMTERYHANYELYEESIADLFFLYSNVGNGGITHESVYVDIPANVMFTMEKDGVRVAYASRQKVSARGTYVLRLTAVENPELPMSEQTEYQSTFRFRIQDEPPVSEQKANTAGASGTGSTASGTSLTGTGTSLWDNPNVTVYPVEDPKAALEAAADNAKDAVKDAAKDAALDVVNGVVDGVTDKVEEGVGQLVDKAEETLDQVTDKVAQAGAENKTAEPVLVQRSQEYDQLQGKYIVTLENGLELVSTVPEGYVGPSAVGLNVAEGAAERVQLYRDDELVEFVNGNSQMEPGAYRLVLDGCSYSFIIAHSVSNMDLYPAPAGMRFTEVRLDDEQAALTSDQSLIMAQDGTYTIFMEGEAGEELQVTLVKDTTAPEVVVTVKGGNAAIQYISEDITAVILEKDGAVIEGFGGTAISTPGSYRLTVADEAGNTAAVDFVLNYQVNMYGILAVVLVILVIAAVIGFVLHTKKNMKIR